MAAESAGWFELVTDLATAGTRYRFRIDGGALVPDPASRYQPDDVHGPSMVVDPGAWEWQDAGWHGRPWAETVIYELHVGAFSAQGSFAAVREKLDHLVSLGVTAIELMPIADFPGARNWGYDGVYLFAPDGRYGSPEDLKALIDAAHARGLMVFLDVVYNHFGPEGNYLHIYAPQFFTQRHVTPWGDAINYDVQDSTWVRQFFIHNTLYWLEEYHFDGLRFDAVHAIQDDTQPDILTELAERVRHTFGDRRHIHLALENDRNDPRYLTRDTERSPCWYVAQWNDDIHHALHVLLTGETGGYYEDYADDPLAHLARCLAEGFAYQGEPSTHRGDEPRGQSSAHLPPTAFVSFLQNHDQIGNRAFGERIDMLAEPRRVRAALALLLLAPQPPLLFMGQEWGSQQPFPFFCDFGPELAKSVVSGRRQEFARFPEFSDPDARARIPNPMDTATFDQAVLDWTARDRPAHARRLALHRELLALRRRELMPRLHGIDGGHTDLERLGEQAVSVRWMLGDGSRLILFANLGDEELTGVELPSGPVLYTTHDAALESQNTSRMPPWSVFWYLHAKDAMT